MIRSRSISSRARSGFHLRIITSLPPEAVLAMRIEWQPVAWNSGTDNNMAFGRPVDISSTCSSLAISCPRALMKPRLRRFVQILRWVPRAPFGRPVVPDV